MAKLCLGFWLLCSFVFADTDPRYESALKFLEDAKPAEAISLLETWLTDAEAKGTRSPEVHQTLGAAYGQTEQWGPAVYHLAVSASLRANPLHLGESLRLLSRVQNRLMIQDAVPSHWSFRAALFLGRGLLLALALTGVWFFLFSLLLPALRGSLQLAAAVLLVVAGVGFGVREALPAFAVVVAGAQGAPLTSSAETSDSKKLVDIPSGTVVALSKTAGPLTSITQPFAGWVASDALRILNF